jgi:hypothetical protein
MAATRESWEFPKNTDAKAWNLRESIVSQHRNPLLECLFCLNSNLTEGLSCGSL